jgi:formylglycine-generating enzyme required for sulfatase activity
VHRVTVDGFWIDRYPVTNEQFAPFPEPVDTSTCHLGFRCSVRER